MCVLEPRIWKYPVLDTSLLPRVVDDVLLLRTLERPLQGHHLFFLLFIKLAELYQKVLVISHAINCHVTKMKRLWEMPINIRYILPPAEVVKIVALFVLQRTHQALCLSLSTRMIPTWQISKLFKFPGQVQHFDAALLTIDKPCNLPALFFRVWNDSFPCLKVASNTVWNKYTCVSAYRSNICHKVRINNMF